MDDPRLAARVVDVAEVSLADERLAWTLDADGVWTRCGHGAADDPHVRLQQLALNRAQSAERVLP